jgi:hypothetical protein
MTDPGVQVNIPAGGVTSTLGERLTSIETKLDIVLKDHGDRLNDHETRIRAQENKSTISPKTLWTSLTGAVITSASAISAIEWLVKH